MKKGQLSMEFVLIFLLVFIVFLGVVGLLIRYVSDSNDYMQQKKVEPFANSIKNEIYLVYKIQGNMKSKVCIPAQLDGQDFEIGLDTSSDHFYITLNGTSTVYRSLPNVTGSIRKDCCNNITKQNGVVNVDGC